MAVFSAATLPCRPGAVLRAHHHPMALPVDPEDLLTTFHDSEFPTHSLLCSERKHAEEVRLWVVPCASGKQESQSGALGHTEGHSFSKSYSGADRKLWLAAAAAAAEHHESIQIQGDSRGVTLKTTSVVWFLLSVHQFHSTRKLNSPNLGLSKLRTILYIPSVGVGREGLL